MANQTLSHNAGLITAHLVFFTVYDLVPCLSERDENDRGL